MSCALNRLIVVKEGRILYFLPCARRFEVRNRKLTTHGRIINLIYNGKQIFALNLIMA